ncbi:MAG: response regulator transcription factor [Chloroflexi bacterium]|nr:response regulator transcription factor [Chloroflexota bacterium]
MAKPFSFAEMLARMRALARRPQMESNAGPLEFGALKLDLLRHEATLAGVPIPLTATEFRLLEFFMSNPGQVLSRPRILDVVWGYGRDVDSNVVDAYIHYLRRKIDIEGQPSAIRTVRGTGYAFGA